MGFKDLLDFLVYVTKSFSEVVLAAESSMSWFVQTECQFSLKGKGCSWNCGVHKLFLWSFLRGIRRVALFEVRVETVLLHSN